MKHKHKIYTYVQRNGSMVTEPNAENYKNRSSKCVYDCVHSFSTQSTQNSLPSSLQTSIIAQMLSIRGEGAVISRNKRR